MTLLIVQYREQLAASKVHAYDLLRRARSNLAKEELEHITDQVKKCKESLERKRIRKATKLCKETGIDASADNLDALRTFDHHQDELFDGEDLPHEEINNRNEGAERLTSIEEDEETELVVLENGRLKGRFVSGTVVNVSRRELSEEDISLLSKGLKFSPTPTSLLNGVAYVPSCLRCWRALLPSCLRAQIFGVPSCHRCWRALVPKCSACPRAFHVGVPSCPCAKIFGVPSCLLCWRALVPKFLACPRAIDVGVPACPRARVPAFLASPRAFDAGVPSRLNFRRALVPSMLMFRTLLRDVTLEMFLESLKLSDPFFLNFIRET